MFVSILPGSYEQNLEPRRALGQSRGRLVLLHLSGGVFEVDIMKPHQICFDSWHCKLIL